MKSILLLLLCSPLMVNANRIVNLDTDTQEVWSGGYWSHGRSEGIYRLVVTGGGIEHYKTQLFVQ
ncbi:hypothetical protein DBZ36_03350 [Alginatibacterium sediminis]|uniref:Uncharacterized protein n=1 Tax=Alginatibacterium sediminis TaxID=2164068 RepID=A0A420EFN7_9ALTE|nr:hypothetical protein DBZ36_03350 [Alginatibacterium sediminis]